MISGGSVSGQSWMLIVVGSRRRVCCGRSTRWFRAKARARRLDLHLFPTTSPPSNTHSSDPPYAMSISASSRDKFLSVWPQLSDELVAYLDKEGMPADAKAWFKSVRSLMHRSVRKR